MGGLFDDGQLQIKTQARYCQYFLCFSSSRNLSTVHVIERTMRFDSACTDKRVADSFWKWYIVQLSIYKQYMDVCNTVIGLIDMLMYNPV